MTHGATETARPYRVPGTSAIAPREIRLPSPSLQFAGGDDVRRAAAGSPVPAGAAANAVGPAGRDGPLPLSTVSIRLGGTGSRQRVQHESLSANAVSTGSPHPGHVAPSRLSKESAR